jgi:hypothetical protein
MTEGISTRVFICTCHSVDHQFVVEYIDDEPDVYISIRLNSFGNVFQRIYRALKYVFKAGEGDYAEVILEKDKQKELEKFLQR